MLENTLDRLKEFISAKKEISLAFLFGSQVKGYARPISDYDLAVWFIKAPELGKIDRLWREIEKIVGKEVDLVILNNARPTVAWAALRGKKILIRDWRLYFNLILNVSTEAEDMQDFNISLWNLKEKIRSAPL
ncbi:MAG: nucleotidyltransferase domain-containing protein [Candidatus Margulisbacteria bacterium]|nr:nucleotidyltransferase domain-containing protein [Candidatus Margulisiibacteriota bacterium]